MPTHKAFFPEPATKTKSVNESITIPQPVTEPPITIKSDYKPKPKTEVEETTPKKPELVHKPVDYAPPPVILPKKNIFFNMY